MFNKIKAIFDSLTGMTTKSIHFFIGEKIDPSGEIVTLEIPLNQFTDIYNNDNIDLIISPHSFDKTSQVITIKADKNIIDYIKCTQNDNCSISYKHLVHFTGKAPIVEIPSNFLTTITNLSHGDIHILEGVDIADTISNEGAGNIKAHQFSGSFINVDSLGDVTIENINTESLTAVINSSGNLNIENGQINHLICDVDSLGDVTILANIEKANFNSSSSGNIKVGTIELEADISLDSLGDIEASGPISTDLKIKSSSSGNISIFNLDNQTTTIELDSLGDILLSGKTHMLNISSNGSGNVYAKKLMSSLNYIESESIGDIILTPTDSLDVYSNGSGNIVLKGDATLTDCSIVLESLGEVITNSVTIELQNNPFSKKKHTI